MIEITITCGTLPKYTADALEIVSARITRALVRYMEKNKANPALGIDDIAEQICRPRDMASTTIELMMQRSELVLDNGKFRLNRGQR